MIPQFCKHAEDWMNEHPENIVAIHCKAGKGRTGVLICCLLLWLKKFDDPDEAMDFYGEQRTHNGKGVTIPSQKRFIRYFHKTITEGTPPPHTTSLLQKITVNGVSTFEDTHFALQIESNGSVIKYLKKGDKGLVYVLGKDSVTLDLGVVPVSGNTKVTLFKPGKKKELLVHFWFHCHYMTEPSFKMIKHEIDKAVSDRQHKVFPENFSIEVNFEPTGIYDDKKEVKQEKVDKKEESEGKSEEKESKSEDVEKKEEDEEEEEEEEETEDDEDDNDKKEDDESDIEKSKSEEKSTKNEEEEEGNKDIKDEDEDEEEEEAEEEAKEASKGKKELKNSKKSKKSDGDVPEQAKLSSAGRKGSILGGISFKKKKSKASQ